METSESLAETRKKKSRINIHCKVLLAKNNNFPFIGSHTQETKKAESLSTQETRESQSTEQNV